MTDVPDEILQWAQLVLITDVQCDDDDRDNTKRIARALMEAEARGYARAKEQAAKVADDHAQAWGLAMASPAITIATAIRSMEMSDEQT